MPMKTTRMKTMAILTGAAVMLAACGGGSGSGSAGSGLNPLGWFGGGSRQQTTLTPDGGYPTARQDGRAQIAQITGARWEPLYEGRMLLVEALPNTKGWWAAELVTELPMSEGRIRGDENGVLRLRLVGLPPLSDTYPAAVPAQAPTDTLTVSLTLPHEALASIEQVVITGAGNSVTLRK